MQNAVSSIFISSTYLRFQREIWLDASVKECWHIPSLRGHTFKSWQLSEKNSLLKFVFSIYKKPTSLRERENAWLDFFIGLFWRSAYLVTRQSGQDFFAS